MYNVALKYLFLLIFLIMVINFLLPLERMTVASYIVLSAAIILLPTSYYLTRDLGSPQVILCATWFMSLFLTSLTVEYAYHIQQFNQMLTLSTWMLILGAIIAFLIGSTVAMYPIRTCFRENIGETKLDWGINKLRLIIFVSFAIALSIYLFAVLKHGGVPAFSDNVNKNRASFIPGTIGVFLTLFQLTVLLTSAKFVIYGLKSTRIEIFLAIISLVCSFLTTQRIAAIETMLMSVIIVFVLWPYTSREVRRRRKKIIYLYGPLLIVLFVWSFIYIGQTRGLGDMPLTDIKNHILEQFFIYFGGPAPRNLQMAMEGGMYHGINETKHGALFVRPFLWFMNFRNEVSINDTFKGPNNATALFHYYLDFGVIAILLIPLFWGGVCGYVYGSFRRTLKLRTGVLYAILASAIYFFPLSERFSEPSTFVKAVIFTFIITAVLWLPLKIRHSHE
jgi:oligosaccharide repeat unit polymerase